jgi:fructose/tagatose bisphosphate aldolase
MTLARLRDLLVSVAASGTGLGAFNVFSIERAEAFTAAADVATTPVVLQISQNAVR